MDSWQEVAKAVSPAFNASLNRCCELQVEDYVNDKLNFVGKVRARTAHEILKGFSSLEQRQSQLTLPILAVHGTADRCTSLPVSSFYEAPRRPHPTCNHHRCARHHCKPSLYSPTCLESVSKQADNLPCHLDCSWQAVRRLTETCHSKDVTLTEMPGGYHELIMGPEKEQVIPMVRDWILAHAVRNAAKM